MKMLSLIVLSIFLLGCLGQTPSSTTFKGIEGASIHGKCAAHADDVCRLFGCMVDHCWCNDDLPGGAILKEGEGIMGGSDDAMVEVQEYLWRENPGMDAMRVAELNPVFYSVFATNKYGEEETYIVAKDGTIMKTLCGV